MELNRFCRTPYFKQNQFVFVVRAKIVIVFLVPVFYTSGICNSAAENGIEKSLTFSRLYIIVYFYKTFHNAPPIIARICYFNPLPPRGGRLAVPLPVPGVSVISIHSLREEGDRGLIGLDLGKNISIHSLREEGDFPNVNDRGIAHLFQSTPSARRETFSYCYINIRCGYFNPLPPRGGRLLFYA